MKANTHRRQPTPEELTAALLDFLHRKFYAGEDRAFAKDRSRLLAWVVLWPASWFNNRGVTVHGDSYRDIFFDVFLNADANRTGKIKYRPAWMKMVIQSHFRIHGEDYYRKAKAVGLLADQALLVAGQSTGGAAPDPVRELALANNILSHTKRKKKKAAEAPINEQLSLV